MSRYEPLGRVELLELLLLAEPGGLTALDLVGSRGMVRTTAATALLRMYRRGHAERLRVVPGDSEYVYWITERGRKKLAYWQRVATEAGFSAGGWGDDVLDGGW